MNEPDQDLDETEALREQLNAARKIVEISKMEKEQMFRKKQEEHRLWFSVAGVPPISTIGSSVWEQGQFS